MKQLIKQKFISILLGLGILLCSAYITITPANFVNQFVSRIDSIIYDLRLKLSIEPPKNLPPIVIIDIDEKSLKEHGRWPWPRNDIAKLIKNLREAGVTVIAFDMVFSEPEKNPAQRVIAALGEDYVNKDLLVELESVVPLVDNDKMLSLVLNNDDVVLGYILHHEEALSVGTLPDPILVHKGKEAYTLNHLEGYTGNLKLLQEKAKLGGFVTTIRDADGIVRRSPLLIQHEDSIYTSLGLEAVRNYLLIDQFKINTIKVGDFNTIESIQLDNQKIPTDARGQVIVPFRGGAKTFPYYSAVDILNKNYPKTGLQDTIAFIGTSALGLSDLHPMPLHRAYPGVEVHANIAAGILEDNFPYRPNWAQGAELSLLVAIGLLAAFLFPFLDAIWVAVGAVVLSYGSIYADFLLWKQMHISLSISILVMMVLLQATVNLIYGFAFEHRRRVMIKNLFGQYVPPMHVDKMSDSPGKYGFEGESREMTVLFADIRNFTTISESLDASEVKAMLNEFFTPMTEIIFSHGGTIDKYIGDLIMAFWGAPMKDEQHAKHAIEASFVMLQEAEKLKEHFLSKGLPEVNIGIGLNTGIMNVGDMGSSFRRAYTVLGDAVNLGSRLEASTKFYGVKCIVGENTIEGQKEFLFRKLDQVRVKGKIKPVKIYEPIGRFEALSDEQVNDLELYHKGLDYYYDRSWRSAKEVFMQLQIREHHAIFQIYLDRIAELEANPPDEDWDGTFVREEK